jgi:hypothetical protein
MRPFVAAQAQVRLGLLEQGLVRGAVGFVAYIAAFGHGRMLVDKRARLFGMALKTGLFYALGLKVPQGAAVGIMAAYALHFTLVDGVVGRKLPVRFLFGMALVAGFVRAFFKLALSLARVNAVALAAGQSALRV